MVHKSHKYIWSANCKSANCKSANCGRSTNPKKIKSANFSDLRIAELICGPPIFYIYTIYFRIFINNYKIIIKMLFFFLNYLRFIFIFHVFLTKSVGFKYFFHQIVLYLVFCLPTYSTIQHLQYFLADLSLSPVSTIPARQSKTMSAQSLSPVSSQSTR